MEFKTYVEKYLHRIERINSLFNLKELKIGYDILSNKVKKAQRELLYFNFDSEEDSGAFIFGFNYFISELNEQEFKRLLGQNSMNYKIYKAYYDLSKSKKKIKISEILNKIQDGEKDSLEIHKLIERILSLAYYFNWNLERDKKDIEGDSFVEMSNRFLLKVKQRFNFDIISSVFENDEIFIFLNVRGKLNIVFKNLDEFNKRDIEKKVLPILKKIFGINKITE